MPQLTKAPSVDVGLLIRRRPPHDVFEALADPSITTRFWYTKSTGAEDEDGEDEDEDQDSVLALVKSVPGT